MLVDGGKEWDCYNKMKVIIKKKWEIVIKKVNKKKEAIIFLK
jgi:hypothetical protein